MRARRLVLLLPFAALLAGCATTPFSVEVSRQQLQAALERRFPYEVRSMGMVLLRFGDPRLQLQPDVNRVRVDLGVDAADQGATAARLGELAVSFAVRYEPADASLRAAGVRVDHLAMRGVPELVRGLLQDAASGMAETLLDDAVLHTLRPEDLARLRGWTPAGVRVTATGLRFEFMTAR